MNNIFNANPAWKQIPAQQLSKFTQMLTNIPPPPPNQTCAQLHQAVLFFLQHHQDKEPALQLGQTLNKLNRIKDIPQTKSRVCGKLMKKGDKAYQCYDCMTSDNSLLCSDCFQLEKHQGHDFERINVGGGCCDCGDIEAWKQQCFCEAHSKAQEIQIIVDQKVLQLFMEEQTYAFRLLLIFFKYLHHFQLMIIESNWGLPLTANIDEKLKKQSSRKVIELVDTYGRHYFAQLIEFNKAGKVANKMTETFLNSEIGQQIQDIKAEVQSKPVINHIFSLTQLKMSSRSVTDLFMTMFSRVGFREQVTQLFLKFYNSDPDFIHTEYTHLSCQLLTSHLTISKLIKEGRIDALKYEPQCQDEQAINEVSDGFLRLYYDINYLAQLYGDAPFHYFKLHAQQRCFTALGHYRIIFNQYPRAINYYGLDQIFISRMMPVVKIIKKDSTNQIARFAIRELYQFISQLDTAEHNMFRPQERLFTLIVFSQMGGKLDELDNDEYVQTFFEIFGVNNFEEEIKNIIKNICSVFITASNLLENHKQIEKKYTFYSFYLKKSKLLFNLDAILLKIVLRMCQVYSKTHPFNYNTFFVQGPKNPAHIIFNSNSKQIAGTDMLVTYQHLKNYMGLVTQAVFSDLPMLAVACAFRQTETAKNKKKDVNTTVDYGATAMHYYECLLLSEETNKILIKQFKKSAELFFKEDEVFKQFVKKHIDPEDRLRLVKPSNVQKGAKINSLHFKSIGNLPTQKYKSGDCLPAYMNWNSTSVLDCFNAPVSKAIQGIKLIYERKEKAKQTYKHQYVPYLIAELWRISFFSKSNVSAKVLEQLLGIDWVWQEVLFLGKEFGNTIQEKNIENTIMINQEQTRRHALHQKLDKKKAEMRQRMQKNTQMMFQGDSLKDNEISEQKIEDKTICCLCKETGHSQDLFFLGFVTFTTGNSWLSIDPQLNCIPIFDSCEHVVHLPCFHKIMLKNNTKKVYHYCPLCKKTTNIILPQKQNIQKGEADAFVENLSKVYQTLEYECKQEEIENAVTQSLVFEMLFKGLLHFEEFNKNIKVYRILYKLQLIVIEKQKNSQDIKCNMLKLAKEAPEIFLHINIYIVSALLGQQVQVNLSENFTKSCQRLISLLCEVQTNSPTFEVEAPEVGLVRSSIVFPSLQNSLDGLNSKYRGKCWQCGLVTNKQMICLGCPQMVTCSNCTEVSIRKHAQKYHKGLAVFVKTATGEPLYIMRNRSWPFESLYQDYIGRIYHNSNPREHFTLNPKKFEEVKKDVLHMKIQQRVRYKEKQTSQVYHTQIF